MPTPYIGEIRLFGANFAPVGWATCDGQTLAIATNMALYNVIGTTYGGDGVTTFKLPNLEARVPVHMGTDPTSGAIYALGETGGTTSVTLTVAELPTHNHAPAGTLQATSSDPTSNGWASGEPAYSNAAPSIPMAASTVANTGGSQPHDNMMPYLAVTFIIALEGSSPS